MSIDWGSYATGQKERCGLLQGTRTPTAIHVTGLVELRNWADDPYQDFIIRRSEASGIPYVGFWHTHPSPTHDIGPSSWDIEQMSPHKGLVAAVINPIAHRVSWFGASGLLAVWRYDIPEVAHSSTGHRATFSSVGPNHWE